MKQKLIVSFILLNTLIALGIVNLSEAQGQTYYISPTGNDNNSGTSPSAPWGTFNHAWNNLYPGDTLTLMDGTYYQKLHPNKRNGKPGSPITIRAQNDGKAIIDGQHQRTPVQLGEAWPGPIGQYFVIEGIVARNSSDSVYSIRDDHNVLRRVSGHNANTDTNSHVFNISANNTLLEDCIASGAGRKMILVYKGENNTVRRCAANWQRWDGRDFCGVTWPNGGNIHVYNASNNIVENSIAIGPVPKWSVLVQANSSQAKATNNKVLGTIAIRAGMNADGSVRNWGSSRPGPTSCTSIIDFDWPGHRAGFVLYGQGELRNNLFRDILSWGNAGLGFSFLSGAGFHPNTGNNRVDHATLYGNGLDNPEGPWPGRYGGKNTDVLQEELNRFSSVSNSNIENIFVDWPNYPNGERNMASMNGAGTRLTTRYIDGTLTNEPLWPWPMDDRMQAELGFTATDLITPLFDPSADPGNFSISASPESATINAGGTADFTITLTPIGNFTDTVTIDLENPDPSLLDVNINTTSVSLPAQLEITIEDHHDPSAQAVWYSVPVTASSDGNGDLTHAVNLNLLVEGHNDYIPFVSSTQ